MDIPWDINILRYTQDIRKPQNLLKDIACLKCGEYNHKEHLFKVSYE